MFPRAAEPQKNPSLEMRTVLTLWKGFMVIFFFFFFVKIIHMYSVQCPQATETSQRIVIVNNSLAAMFLGRAYQRCSKCNGPWQNRSRAFPAVEEEERECISLASAIKWFKTSQPNSSWITSTTSA